MAKVTKLPNNTRQESQMLDYVLRVIDRNGKVLEAWRFEGYSGHSMWDVEKSFRDQYRAVKGHTITW